MLKANFGGTHLNFMIFVLPQLTKKEARPDVYRMLLDNKWIYIGSSENIQNRIRRWHACLNTGQFYKNLNIKMVLPKCKEVKFEILHLLSTKEAALEKENQLLKSYENYEWLLNRCPDASSPKGLRPYIRQAPRPIRRTRAECRKPVAKFNSSGEFIEKYPSVKDAAASAGIQDKRMPKVIRENRGRHKDFIYKYINPDGSFAEPTYKKRNRKRRKSAP